MAFFSDLIVSTVTGISFSIYTFMHALFIFSSTILNVKKAIFLLTGFIMAFAIYSIMSWYLILSLSETICESIMSLTAPVRRS